jgi:hypothetical protein
LRAVDSIVGEYATAYCGLPFRRREVGPEHTDDSAPRVVWSIEGHTVVEYMHDDAGPGRLVVHEISLLKPLRKQLRSRHVRITYAETMD